MLSFTGLINMLTWFADKFITCLRFLISARYLFGDFIVKLIFPVLAVSLTTSLLMRLLFSFERNFPNVSQFTAKDRMRNTLATCKSVREFIYIFSIGFVSRVVEW